MNQLKMGTDKFPVRSSDHSERDETGKQAKKLRDFKKGLKPDVGAYPAFDRPYMYPDWRRSFAATAEAQGLGEIHCKRKPPLYSWYMHKMPHLP